MPTLARLCFVSLAMLAGGFLATLFADDEVGATPAVLRSPEALETLVAPIALYPDPLLAHLLPAATQPTQIVLAARLLREKPTSEQIDAQPWDESVKALARFPDVLKMMDEKLAWTEQLGEAFLAQPDAVMDAVQRLRAKARALGNLISTEQQTVLVEGEIIQIVPAQVQTIYVPSYRPEIVYVERPIPGQYWLSFGFGFTLGSWFNHDCDWHRRRVVVWSHEHPRPPEWWHHRRPEPVGPHPEHLGPRPEAWVPRHQPVNRENPRRTFEPRRPGEQPRVNRPHDRQPRVTPPPPAPQQPVVSPVTPRTGPRTPAPQPAPGVVRHQPPAPTIGTPPAAPAPQPPAPQPPAPPPIAPRVSPQPAAPRPVPAPRIEHAPAPRAPQPPPAPAVDKSRANDDRENRRSDRATP